jgi:hypothetical protein
MKNQPRNTSERLAYGAEMLSRIDQRRAETGCAYLGANIECIIIERELAELEQQMYAATMNDQS